MDPAVTEMEDVTYSLSNPTPNTNIAPNSNIAPNTALNPTPDTTPNTTPIELKSPKKEGDDEPLLDVPTRWNSTFQMLDVALKFEKAFGRYEDEDDKFLSYFAEKENGKKRVGPPMYSDWQAAAVFVKFLATFYEVTLKFSSTLNVTSNNFYHEICEVQALLSDLAATTDPLLSSMAASMKGKFDKYWGNAEDINPLMFVAVVLDPRYKIGYLKYCFENVYEAECAARIVVKVESLLQRLYMSYDSQGDKVDGNGITFPPKTTGSGCVPNKRRLLENYMHQQKMETSEKKNDLDKYLTEEPINPMNSSFDILMWWKDNSERYKILSLIARDVLAIPVSTVASESAFSTSGRILDPFRSSLSPKMVEVLVCTQSWLKGDKGGVKLDDFMDETYFYQFVEEENVNKTKDQMTSEEIATKNINIIDV